MQVLIDISPDLKGFGFIMAEKTCRGAQFVVAGAPGQAFHIMADWEAGWEANIHSVNYTDPAFLVCLLVFLIQKNRGCVTL